MPKSLKVYNLTKHTFGALVMPKVLEDASAKPTAVHQVITSLFSNQRRATSKVKTRGLVSGGGRKPWKQKGTGRARAGSIRSPLWRGGGITFGPTGEENYHKSIPKKLSRAVRRTLLKEKIQNNELILVDKFSVLEFKTQALLKTLSALPLKDGTILILVEAKNAKLWKAASNPSYLKVVLPSTLNLIDLMKYDNLLAEAEAFKKLL